MSDAGKGAGGGVEKGEPALLRRLVDEPPGDLRASGTWAINLLRGVSPYRPPVGRKQRVQLGLGQGGRRRRSPLLRPAIAGVVLIGCGAAASAALGRWPDLVARAYQRLLAPPAVDAPPAADPRARHAGPRATAHPSSIAPAAEVAGVAGEPVAAPSISPPSAPLSPIGVRESPREARGPSASWRPRRSPPAAAAASAEDTTPVLEAMRALRVDGHPARARALLAGYLERHPNGTLAEEALAMTIEAAVAHDDGDAAVLARRYLRRYPAGHFSALAHQTLDGEAGAPR